MEEIERIGYMLVLLLISINGMLMFGYMITQEYSSGDNPSGNIFSNKMFSDLNTMFVAAEDLAELKMKAPDNLAEAALSLVTVFGFTIVYGLLFLGSFLYQMLFGYTNLIAMIFNAMNMPWLTTIIVAPIVFIELVILVRLVVRLVSALRGGG